MFHALTGHELNAQMSCWRQLP